MLHLFKKSPRRIVAKYEQTIAELQKQLVQDLLACRLTYGRRRAAIEMLHVAAVNELLETRGAFTQLSRNF